MPEWAPKWPGFRRVTTTEVQRLLVTDKVATTCQVGDLILKTPGVIITSPAVTTGPNDAGSRGDGGGLLERWGGEEEVEGGCWNGGVERRRWRGLLERWGGGEEVLI